jgi:hypothetical protein
MSERAMPSTLIQYNEVTLIHVLTRHDSHVDKIAVLDAFLMLVKASSRLELGMRVSFDTEYQENHAIKLRKDAVFNLKVAQSGLPFTKFFLAEW